MSATLLVIQIVLAILIVIVVLLQKSSSIGLGAYSGSNDSLFGAKGPASFIAKITMLLAILFIINTVALGYFYNKSANKSVIDSTPLKDSKPPLIPLNPLENNENNLLINKDLNQDNLLLNAK